MGIAKLPVLEFTLGRLTQVIDLAGSNARYSNSIAARARERIDNLRLRSPTPCPSICTRVKLRQPPRPRCSLRQAIIADAYSFRDANLKLALGFDLYLEACCLSSAFPEGSNRESIRLACSKTSSGTSVGLPKLRFLDL